ncbi:MAG: hypothetical protein JWM38_1904 [Sphingomonas bacterium]|jgi:hypothetical protein|nr:hypothetical protein [Sphingomonas bacterium]MDB5682958.1 hypothetical protein [Sphingomonas bacterium]MDB5718477.1 hypothetical protein [Sphingomonas bacterium]
MPDDLSEHLDQINRLAPAARERVSQALKASVAAELGSGAGPGTQAAEFSKGAFFSRSRGNAMIEENKILERAANMDQQSFTKFAQNLQTLKGLKGGGPG